MPPKKELLVSWEPTAKLLQALNPENPRDHFEDDIQATALSLLEAGWAEIGVSRQKNGYLIGGHGRVQAADWLSKQSPDWFDHQWQKWIAATDARQSIADEHRERFSPDYWSQCPVKYNNLDELTQKATMIRLNNQAKDGRDNQKRMAALLDQMPKGYQEQAGWDSKTAEIFISAFVQRKQEKEPEDRIDRQLFERPDATVYDPDNSPNDASEFSGPMTSDWGGNDEEFDISQGFSVDESGMVQIEEIDELDAVNADVFDFTKAYSETRAVLYLSQAEYEEYKALVARVADHLKIDTQANIAKIWRSQAVMAALRTIDKSAGGAASGPDENAEAV